MRAKEWAERYRIGVREIDEQHGMLFELLDRFEQVSGENCTPELQAEVLQKLVSYVDFHFRAEEKLMASCHFPELKNHVAQHREFEGQLIAYVMDFEQNHANIAAPLAEFLKKWIFEHILVEDTKIGRFLGESAKGEGQ